jgi:hypothetical protein
MDEVLKLVVVVHSIFVGKELMCNVHLAQSHVAAQLRHPSIVRRPLKRII